jgi:hypothetical protein
MLPLTMPGRQKKECKEKVHSAEPKIKWKKSEARRLLHKAIRDGEVPLDAKDEGGQSAMPLKNVHTMHPENALCSCDKFSSPPSGLRKTIKEANNRAEDDERHFSIAKATTVRC